jgi:hypothetical protein
MDDKKMVQKMQENILRTVVLKLCYSAFRPCKQSGAIDVQIAATSPQ